MRDSIGHLEAVGGPSPTSKSLLHRFTLSRRRSTSCGPVSAVRPRDARSAPARSSSSTARRARSTLKRGSQPRGRPAAGCAPARRAPTHRAPRRTRSSASGTRSSHGDRRYPAVESVLRRETFGRDVQTTDLDEMAELLLSLDGRHLVIQGPPGSGKTWTPDASSRALLEAGQARRRRLDEPQGDPQPASRGRRRRTSRRHAASRKSRPATRSRSTKRATGSKTAPTAPPASKRRSPAAPPGCTRTRTSTAQLDYLFIDEAGQVSLADALAMATAARNLVLARRPAAARAGDPGNASRRRRRIRAAAPARRARDDPARPPACSSRRPTVFTPTSRGYISREFYDGRLRAGA